MSEGPARGGPSRAFRWCREHGGGLEGFELLKSEGKWNQICWTVLYITPLQVRSPLWFALLWQCSPFSLLTFQYISCDGQPVNSWTSKMRKMNQLRMCQPMEREDRLELAEQLHSLVELRFDEHSLRCWLHVLTFIINFNWFCCFSKLTCTDINRCHTISVILFSALTFSTSLQFDICVSNPGCPMNNGRFFVFRTVSLHARSMGWNRVTLRMSLSWCVGAFVQILFGDRIHG